MELLGKRVALLQPKIKELETGLLLDEATKSQLQEQSFSDFTKLEVAFVGDEVKKVSVGDFVNVQLNDLKYGHFVEVEGTQYILVQEASIAFKYPK